MPNLFSYFLADRLGCTLAQIEALPIEEYMGWGSYHKVRQQAEELAMKRASRG